jgi:hypothetical protein
MRIFSELWSDEAGVIMSAEAVVLGTVGVVGIDCRAERRCKSRE